MSFALPGYTNTTMSSWSVEAIIALVALIATCIPLLALLLRKFVQRRQVLRPEAGMSRFSIAPDSSFRQMLGVELGDVGHNGGHVVAPKELGISKNRFR